MSARGRGYMMKTVGRRPAAVLAGCAMLCCSCIEIERHRWARIDESEGSIYFRVEGFVASPVTPEGAFPKWVNDLKVVMKPGVEIPTSGRRTYSSGADFSSRYHEVKCGTIVVDRDKQVIDVNVTYKADHSWNKANGQFPIRESE